jgi:predicted porin
MNKNIKLAVAGAIIAASASVANAGIIIPAGEWTLDIGGNVNAYYVSSRKTGSTIIGDLTALPADTAQRSSNSITTGLLPNFLSVSGTTRQNDLDVTFLISINPGGASAAPLAGGSGNENRQAFMTFGDKSWGSFKLGKDLGVFASDAILNDMTLLGVGAGAASRNPNTTTLGRIGTGFVYADWKNQVAYTTPNMNGFQATLALTQGWNSIGSDATYSATSTQRAGGGSAYEGKASYAFSANDVTGKVWVSGISQKIGGVVANDSTAWGADIGANVNVANFGLTGYYYGGEGLGITATFRDGFDNSKRARDSDGGYVQATYKLPTATKLGIAWGQSNLDANDSGDAAKTAAFVKTQELWTAGLYHPLTKHVNLVAEYNNAETEGNTGTKSKVQSVSFGGILFF